MRKSGQMKRVGLIQNFAFSSGVGDKSKDDDSKEGDVSMISSIDGMKH